MTSLRRLAPTLPLLWTRTLTLPASRSRLLITIIVWTLLEVLGDVGNLERIFRSDDKRVRARAAVEMRGGKKVRAFEIAGVSDPQRVSATAKVNVHCAAEGAGAAQVGVVALDVHS